MGNQADLYCETTFENTLVRIRAWVQIRKDATSVFAFFGDMLRDPEWRNEIRSCDKPAANLIRQFSYLSPRQPAFRQDYNIEVYDAGKMELLARAIPGSPHFQDSFRKVEALSDSTCRAIYEISFNRAILKTALGFDLPDFLLRFQMNRVCRKYLKAMRILLEK